MSFSGKELGYNRDKHPLCYELKILGVLKSAFKQILNQKHGSKKSNNEKRSEMDSKLHLIKNYATQTFLIMPN